VEPERSHTDWQRLGAAVRDRRNELGLSQGEDGPSAATWRKVEKAIEPPYAERTLRAICRVLRWPSDAADRILDGDDPRSLGTSGSGQDYNARIARISEGAQAAIDAIIEAEERKLHS
jgi:hypothetical protein